MMVTFVSQCEKKALNRTRRVLDSFANRIGDNAWQTVITNEGLGAVKKLLRKTASKNTAVSCHWIRSRSRSELVWVVGNRDKFNSEGIVPVNYTVNAIDQYMDSSQWETLEVIKYTAAIAGLFHDFGKANLLFQEKLDPDKRTKAFEPYRHEWLSMRLFQAFVGDKNDAEWLDALSEIEREGFPEYFRDGVDGNMGDDHPQSHPLANLPPLAQLIAWLILVHHKLPIYPGWIKEYRDRPALCYVDDWFGTNFTAAWNSPKCKDEDEHNRLEKNWNFEKGLPVESIKWRSRACEIASAAKVSMSQILGEHKDWLQTQLFTTHSARLCLMLADHYYSNPNTDENNKNSNAGRNPEWRSAKYNVYANTNKVGGRTDFYQQLDEHLIGVAHHAKAIAKALPRLNATLLPLGEVKSLEDDVRKDKKLSEIDKQNFGWQDDAKAEATKLGKATIKQGFFGINMASTGKGKTLGNAKIMYALGNETGRERFSVALGLRTLTLQTGKEFRDKLKLNDEKLAILVGGMAIKQLFEHEQNKSKEENAENNGQYENQSEASGSESQNELLDPELYVDYQGDIKCHSLCDWTQKNDKLEKLINAPVLVSTIDHLIPATEGTKSGKQIGPMLRLLSSELVLDEPDDFGLEDLPALCRLVHWAGMLGSRVLLSTATMPPALAYALFQSYREGWSQYALANIHDWDQNIICAWFDEFKPCKDNGAHQDFDSFKRAHEKFVQRRIKELKEQTQAKRKGKILKIFEDANKTIISRLAATIHKNLLKLHKDHHQSRDGRRISVGLVRMANIDPLVAVAKELLKFNAPQNACIHYCVYHSRYPLAIRHHIESKLDKILKRKKPEEIWQHEDIKNVLARYSEDNHIFVVLASPVAEVGRDHDYDWAVVEPSSMRSIIQLAGRVLRHRDHFPETPNVYLLNENYKALKGEPVCFEKPGFEFRKYGPKMAKYNLDEILEAENFESIDATSRIVQPQYDLKVTEFDNLIHLEHRALAYSLFDKTSDKKPKAANVWWKSNPHWCGEAQRQQRFRDSKLDEAYYLLLENENANHKWRWKNENVRPAKFGEGGIRISTISNKDLEFGPGSYFWFDLDAKTVYSKLAEEIEDMSSGDLRKVSECFGEVRIIEYQNSSDQEYEYHPELGVYKTIGGAE